MWLKNAISPIGPPYGHVCVYYDASAVVGIITVQFAGDIHLYILDRSSEEPTAGVAGAVVEPSVAGILLWDRLDEIAETWASEMSHTVFPGPLTFFVCTPVTLLSNEIYPHPEHLSR